MSIVKLSGYSDVVNALNEQINIDIWSAKHHLDNDDVWEPSHERCVELSQERATESIKRIGDNLSCSLRSDAIPFARLYIKAFPNYSKKLQRAVERKKAVVETISAIQDPQQMIADLELTGRLSEAKVLRDEVAQLKSLMATSTCAERDMKAITSSKLNCSQISEDIEVLTSKIIKAKISTEYEIVRNKMVGELSPSDVRVHYIDSLSLATRFKFTELLEKADSLSRLDVVRLRSTEFVTKTDRRNKNTIRAMLVAVNHLSDIRYSKKMQSEDAMWFERGVNCEAVDDKTLIKEASERLSGDIAAISVLSGMISD